MQFHYPVDPGHSLVDDTFSIAGSITPLKCSLFLVSSVGIFPTWLFLLKAVLSQIWIEMVLVSLQERDSINVWNDK